MAKQKRSKLISGAMPQRMTFAGGSAGALDPSAQPLPETSLQRFFADEAAVAKFNQPVKPRLGNGGAPPAG